jgi:hypothetical protein
MVRPRSRARFGAGDPDAVALVTALSVGVDTTHRIGSIGPTGPDRLGGQAKVAGASMTAARSNPAAVAQSHTAVSSVR